MAERFDVLIAGAGPAGLAAAQAVGLHGARAAVIDAQAAAGGQVWRRDVLRPRPFSARKAIARAFADGVDFFPQTQIVAASADELLLEGADGASILRYGRLVIATGARELLLPFPGWTLPGVTGAGGLQALVKQGWPIAERRVVVAGSGPLLLAAAASLRRHGAQVLGVYEQASARSVRAFAAALVRWPARAIQAVGLRAALAGVPYHCGAFVRAAHGDAQLQSLEIETPLGLRRIDCEYLAVGFGLVPNIELAQLVGCRLDASRRHPCIAVDEQRRTSVPNVYAAGEVCGIGGCDAARIDGAIAGYGAVGAVQAAQRLQPAGRRARNFAALLQQHFALDDRIRTLSLPDTLICRCEDVPMAALEGFADSRAAKLATRCGMGACQGRICGAALAELDRFAAASARAPLFPARLSTFTDSITATPT